MARTKHHGDRDGAKADLRTDGSNETATWLVVDLIVIADSGVGTNRSVEDVPILRPEQIRLIGERQALVVAENAPPLIAELRRCLDGKPGRAHLARQAAARDQVGAARDNLIDAGIRTAAAVAYARQHRLSPADATGGISGGISGDAARPDTGRARSW